MNDPKPSTGEPLSLPESKETLTMQLKQLADGKRPAVFVAEGSPKVLVPRGMNTIPTQEGRIHFNPEFMSADHVRQVIANGRLSDLLGYVQNKVEALDNSLRSGNMPKFVVSRDEDGIEQDAAAVSPDRVHEQAQIFAQRAKPGSKVGIEDSFKTIASREKSSRYSPEQKKELEELKSYTTKRASGGPVMHDDTRYALRLANGRQGYADGGAPTMVGASQPMGADPTTQFIRNLANAGFPPEQINAILGSQTQQLPGTQQQAISQQQLMPAQMPQQFPLDRQVGRTFRNYGQPADQATIDNIVGRINAGDFSYDQFNDWAKGQYGRPVGGIGTPPPGSEQPIDAQPIVGDGSQPGNPRYYRGGSPIFPPSVDGGGMGAEFSFTPPQGQPMPEFLPPGGQMTAPDIFAPLQAGQSPTTSTPNYSDTNPTDGLRNQSDFQHDLANQIAQLGFPDFGAPQQNQLNAPSQSNALNIANSAIMGQQPAYGAGLIQGGDGGFGPGKDGSGTMAHGPGGAALGSGLKNGPSMTSGGYGGFGSGYKNGPSGNFGGGGFMPGGMGGMGFR